MGCPSAHALRALRFSAGWETTEADWGALLRAIVQVYGEGQSAKQSARP